MFVKNISGVELSCKAFGVKYFCIPSGGIADIPNNVAALWLKLNPAVIIPVEVSITTEVEEPVKEFVEEEESEDVGNTEDVDDTEDIENTEEDFVTPVIAKPSRKHK